MIREIVEKTGAKIDISDDGTVKVASASGDAMKAAINWIKSIASEPEVGHIYEGTVVKVMDFGAFVNFFGAKDGLVHISQLAPRRVQKVTDVVKEGDKVKVKLLGFDERGKVRLSMKVVDQQTGEDLEAKQRAEAENSAPSSSARLPPAQSELVRSCADMTKVAAVPAFSFWRRQARKDIVARILGPSHVDQGHRNPVTLSRSCDASSVAQKVARSSSPAARCSAARRVLDDPKQHPDRVARADLLRPGRTGCSCHDATRSQLVDARPRRI